MHSRTCIVAIASKHVNSLHFIFQNPDLVHFIFKKPDLDTGTKLHNPWIVTLSFALYTECSHYLPPTASPKLPYSASVAAAAAAAARRGIAATAVAATAAVLRQHCGAAAEMERRHIFFWHDHDRSHISQTRRLELLFLEAMPSLSFSTELSCADASNKGQLISKANSKLLI